MPPAPISVAASSNEEMPPVDVDDMPPPVIENLTDAPLECAAPEEVLSSFARERELLKKNREQLETQKSELTLVREKLAIEKASLLELKDSISRLLSRVEASQTDDLKRLVAVYQNMKPVDAARIMDDMDIEVTVMVLESMKARVAAPILAKMASVRVRAISKIILERSQLPGDQDLAGIRLN